MALFLADLIDEYLLEEKMSATPVLPRLPQVPQTSRVNSAAPSRARRAQPVLVPRGTGPQVSTPPHQAADCVPVILFMV